MATGMKTLLQKFVGRVIIKYIHSRDTGHFFKSNASKAFPALIFLLLCNYSCKNLFSKNESPNEQCIACLQANRLSLQQEKITGQKINAANKEKLLDSLFAYRAKKLGFSGSIFITQKGVTLCKRSYGYENYRSRTPVSDNSKFQLASVSKTFTAVAILHLVEIGKLSLDDSIQQYYPEFPIQHITLRMLLSHRSGLPDYRFAYDDIAAKGFMKFNNQDLMKLMESRPPALQFTPDHKFTYCNTNYAILAAIIETVTGMPFCDYMKQYIFRPVGLTNTYVITDSNAELKNHCTIGYNSNWSEIPRDGFDGIVGDKGVYSTTTDLQTWYSMLRSDCFLKKQTIDLAFQPRSFEKSGKKNYGLGFRTMEYEPGKYFVYHNGWWRGYNTVFYTNPEEDYCIVVLGNRYNRSPYMLKEVIAILSDSKSPDKLGDDYAD